MKTNHAMVSLALLFLLFAAASSVTLWNDIASTVKIGIYAFGFGTGIAAGTLIARRAK
jgi:hypothetical protein